MKRYFITLCLAVLSAAVMLSACTVAPTAPGGHVQTAQEVAAAVCPPVNSTVLALGALALEPKAMADLAIAAEAVKVACGAGAAVDFGSLQTLANSTLPSILGAIKGAGLEVAQQNQLVLNVTAANLILNGAIQAANNAGVVVPPLVK